MIDKTEQKIIVNWKGDINNPTVSIVCATYNHEKYISMAIDSFLMQNTDFAFEILIGEDCSTDNNRAIIKLYADKYPNIIKPIFWDENVGATKNWLTLLKTARGEFIANCEGDDYWTDPRKLQKQVDFLENNPEYVMSGHDAIIIDENGNKICDNKLPAEHKRDFSKEEIMTGNCWVLTLSMVFRRVFNDLPKELAFVFNGDTFLICFLGQFGKSHFHDDIKSAVYRIHSGGVWSMLPEIRKYEKSTQTYMQLFHYFDKQGKTDVADELWKKVVQNITNKEKLVNKYDLKLKYELSVQSFKALLELDTNKEYFIYGYGTIGKVVHKFLGNSIIGILDKELSKNKITNINNTKVYDKIPRKLDENQFVIITPYIYLQEIKEYLDIHDEKIIILN